MLLRPIADLKLWVVKDIDLAIAEASPPVSRESNEARARWVEASFEPDTSGPGLRLVAQGVRLVPGESLSEVSQWMSKDDRRPLPAMTVFALTLAKAGRGQSIGYRDGAMPELVFDDLLIELALPAWRRLLRFPRAPSPLDGFLCRAREAPATVPVSDLDMAHPGPGWVEAELHLGDLVAKNAEVISQAALPVPAGAFEKVPPHLHLLALVRRSGGGPFVCSDLKVIVSGRQWERCPASFSTWPRALRKVLVAIKWSALPFLLVGYLAFRAQAALEASKQYDEGRRTASVVMTRWDAHVVKSEGLQLADGVSCLLQSELKTLRNGEQLSSVLVRCGSLTLSEGQRVCSVRASCGSDVGVHLALTCAPSQRSDDDPILRVDTGGSAPQVVVERGLPATPFRVAIETAKWSDKVESRDGAPVDLGHGASISCSSKDATRQDGQ